MSNLSFAECQECGVRFTFDADREAVAPKLCQAPHTMLRIIREGGKAAARRRLEVEQHQLREHITLRHGELVPKGTKNRARLEVEAHNEEHRLRRCGHDLDVR